MIALAAAAWAGECVSVGLSEVLAVEEPSIVVLGERHGMQPDLGRAKKVVRGLFQDVDVTLALEAVHRDQQAVLDEVGAGSVLPEEIPVRLDWEESWGFPYRPYSPLLETEGVKLVAAGVDLGLPAEPPAFPVPPGYLPLLVEAMQGHEVPPDSQDRFVKAMAYRDFAIADAALAGWDGKGVLVVLVGRGHVEGGKGVQWQLDQRTDVPVHAFVLAHGRDPLCATGDKVWKVGLGG